MATINEYGQPLGEEVRWAGARPPAGDVLEGRQVRLEPLTVAHADGLLELARHPHLWTYLSMEPPADRGQAEFLLASHAFEHLGYRRYEWKCDSLNAPSRRAATRLGFVEEGTWRQALVVKGRNRDTTWFAITDDRWPRVRAAMEAWLDDANVDAGGRQRRSLQDLRAGAAARPT